jgi:hypothetical protein
MDGSQFDDLLRALSRSRRTILGAALAAASGADALPAAYAKKKKKCAKKCKDGCCTSKHGKCIRPAQQSATQCGTGGEICRSGGCSGGGGGGTTTPEPEQPDPICDRESCATCCFGGVCVASTNAHCGFGGITCKPCGANAKCTAEGECCGFVGHDCTGGFTCCDDLKCQGNTCCAEINKSCQKNEDCCDTSNVVCENHICVVRTNKSCQPQQTCQGQYLCPENGTCCDEPCGETCCTNGQHCYGTVCCDLNFGCSRPNGGQGSCCAFEYCCEPQDVGCQCEFPDCCA